MKLKEYPPSLFQLFKLSLLKPDELNKPTDNDINVIVSCTSIPSRFHVLHHTVKSVLSQSSPPKKIVLWLHESHQQDLPNKLLALVGQKFEIRFTHLDSPHCKLVPSLLAFPNECIVTCDDDLLYDKNWLKFLWDKHSKNPSAIIAYYVRRLAYNKNGTVKAYSEWKYDRQTTYCNDQHVVMGYGGVLYPAKSLSSQATESGLYLKLCPKADDLWFKVMSYLKKTPIIAITQRVSINPIPGSQAISLKKSNVNEDKNRLQWNTLCEHFPELNNIANIETS